LFGFIAAGGSAGAIAGPLLTALLVGRLGPTRLLLLAALLLEGACWCARGLSRWSARGAAAPDPLQSVAPSPPDTGVGGSAWAAFRLVVASPYLRGIAFYVLLLSSSSTLGYMLQA